MSGSFEDEQHFLFDCPAYSHIRQQYSHLFHQASSSVAAFLATDLPNVLGGHLRRVLHKDKAWFVRANTSGNTLEEFWMLQYHSLTSAKRVMHCLHCTGGDMYVCSMHTLNTQQQATNWHLMTAT